MSKYNFNDPPLLDSSNTIFSLGKELDFVVEKTLFADGMCSRGGSLVSGRRYSLVVATAPKDFDHFHDERIGLNPVKNAFNFVVTRTKWPEVGILSPLVRASVLARFAYVLPTGLITVINGPNRYGPLNMLLYYEKKGPSQNSRSGRDCVERALAPFDYDSAYCFGNGHHFAYIEPV